MLTPEDALVEDYQVLIIDDVCRSNSRAWSPMCSGGGRYVFGVFDPEDSPDAKERLRNWESMRCWKQTHRRTNSSSLFIAVAAPRPNRTPR